MIALPVGHINLLTSISRSAGRIWLYIDKCPTSDSVAFHGWFCPSYGRFHWKKSYKPVSGLFRLLANNLDSDLPFGGIGPDLNACLSHDLVQVRGEGGLSDPRNNDRAGHNIMPAGKQGENGIGEDGLKLVRNAWQADYRCFPLPYLDAGSRSYGIVDWR